MLADSLGSGFLMLALRDSRSRPAIHFTIKVAQCRSAADCLAALSVNVGPVARPVEVRKVGPMKFLVGFCVVGSIVQ